MRIGVTEQGRIPPWAIGIGLFILALLVRGGLLYYRLVVQGIALRSLGGSDVPGWLGIAHHLYANRDLSYWLLGSRSLLFPMTVALVYTVGGSQLHAAILQVVFGALTPVVGYALARRLLSKTEGIGNPERLALFAGVVMALDPASVSVSATLLSEALFNLLFTACLLGLAVFVENRRWSALGISALSMGLAMLTRPTGIYFWVVAALIVVLLVRRWQSAVLLAVVGLVVYVGWCSRNLYYQGVFTFSTGASFNLLFLRGLSAEHLATGAPTDELQVAYVRTVYERVGDMEAAYGDISSEHFWRFLVPDSPQLYWEMNWLAMEKLLIYWPYALLGTPVGLARMYGWTAMLPRWFHPIEVGYHLFLYGMALWGAWQTYRRKDWATLLLIGAPILYVTGVTLASQTSAMDTRMRTPVTASLAIFAVYGLSAISSRLSRPTSAIKKNP